MTYNNGKSINITEVADIEKAINDFSEGNIYLKRLLLECYNNNIRTLACCAGHEEKEELPYIAFHYSKEYEQIFYYLMLKLKDSGVTFFCNISSTFSPFLSIKFDDYDYKSFQTILYLLQSFDKSKDYYADLPSDLQMYFSIINSINNSNLIKLENTSVSNYFQFYYTKNEDTYNYGVYSNNLDCLSSLVQAGFQQSQHYMLVCYYIDSPNIDENKEILQRLKNILDKKIDKKNNSVGFKK